MNQEHIVNFPHPNGYQGKRSFIENTSKIKYKLRIEGRNF